MEKSLFLCIFITSEIEKTTTEKTLASNSRMFFAECTRLGFKTTITQLGDTPLPGVHFLLFSDLEKFWVQIFIALKLSPNVLD